MLLVIHEAYAENVLKDSGMSLEVINLLQVQLCGSRNRKEHIQHLESDGFTEVKLQN